MLIIATLATRVRINGEALEQKLRSRVGKGHILFNDSAYEGGGGGGKSKLGKTNIYIQCRSCSVRDQFYLPYSPELSLIVSRTPNRSPAK